MDRCRGSGVRLLLERNSLDPQGRAADIRAAASEQDSLSSIAAEAGFAKAIMYKERGFIHLETGGTC